MNRELTPFERYLDDLEEELVTEGHLALSSFAAWLRGDHRGLVPDLSPAALDVMCRRAYGVLTQAYALHLEWFGWPTGAGRPAEADVPLDFGSDGEVPRLALVPDDLDATATKVEAKWAALAAEVRGRGRTAEDPA